MTQEKKLGPPASTLELSVDIDAPIDAAWRALTEGAGLANWFPPEAMVSAPGVGGEVTVKWSDAMAFTTKVDVWEPGQHLRWIDDSGWMGPGTAMTTDYFLESVGGTTRVRLVQSGFGASDGWDDLFDGLKVGWMYFLHNLRVYLERHLGRTRRMISQRIEFSAPREAVWKHLLSASAGLMSGGRVAIKVGDAVEITLPGREPVHAVVEMAIAQRALVLRMAAWRDALLFIELEGGKESFHIGYWLSVYDDALARELDAPAQSAFQHTQGM